MTKTFRRTINYPYILRDVTRGKKNVLALAKGPWSILIFVHQSELTMNGKKNRYRTNKKYNLRPQTPRDTDSFLPFSRYFFFYLVLYPQFLITVCTVRRFVGGKEYERFRYAECVIGTTLRQDKMLFLFLFYLNILLNVAYRNRYIARTCVCVFFFSLYLLLYVVCFLYRSKRRRDRLNGYKSRTIFEVAPRSRVPYVKSPLFRSCLACLLLLLLLLIFLIFS